MARGARLMSFDLQIGISKRCKQRNIVMAKFPYKTALIVGAGPGISTSLARRLSALGVGVGLAARDVEKLKRISRRDRRKKFRRRCHRPFGCRRLFLDTERLLAEPDVVIYNAGSRVARKAN